jgi:hypothetical protein
MGVRVLGDDCVARMDGFSATGASSGEAEKDSRKRKSGDYVAGEKVCQRPPNRDLQKGVEPFVHQGLRAVCIHANTVYNLPIKYE